MKLICCLVARRLAGETQDTERPAYIQRHIEKCERCRTEAEHYNHLRTMLSDEAAVEEPCMLAWEDVRSHINKYPRWSPGLRWSFAPVAAMLALIIAACGSWMWFKMAQQPKTSPETFRQVYSPSGNQSKQPQPIDMQKPSPSIVGPNVRIQTVSKEDRPKSGKHRATGQKRDKNKPARPIPPENLAPAPPSNIIVSNPPDVGPQIEVPDEREMTVIAPEERVIDVVGVNVDVGEDEDSYVIQRVNNCSYASYEL